MNKKLLLVGLSIGLLLSGCTNKSDNTLTNNGTATVAPVTIETTTEPTTESPILNLVAETEDYPALKDLIIKTYDIPSDYLATSKYYYNYVDLNNDGINEIFTVVMGPYTSGSGGSSGMIVYPVGDELHVNQTFTLLQTPLIISDTVTNGAKEIIAYKSGGGAESSYVKLTCSDGNYTSVNDGQALESLEGITGTAIIANDIVKDMENGDFLTLE